MNHCTCQLQRRARGHLQSQCPWRCTIRVQNENHLFRCTNYYISRIISTTRVHEVHCVVWLHISLCRRKSNIASRILHYHGIYSHDAALQGVSNKRAQSRTSRKRNKTCKALSVLTERQRKQLSRAAHKGLAIIYNCLHNLITLFHRCRLWSKTLLTELAGKKYFAKCNNSGVEDRKSVV